MPRPTPLPLLLLTLACGRNHPQLEGRYHLTATEVLQDTCGALARPEELWDATLKVVGHVVWMDSDVLQPPVPMTGLFLSGVERFTADGTVHHTLFRVRGRDCLVDRLAITLDGDTDADAAPAGTEFTGTVRVAARTEGSGEDEACTCEVAASFRAVHETNSPAAAP